MSVRPDLKHVIHGTISVTAKISPLVLVSYLWISSREKSKINCDLGLVTGPP